MTVVVVLCSHSRLFTLGWICPLKREQARHELESELRLVNSLQTLVNLEIGRKSRSLIKSVFSFVQWLNRYFTVFSVVAKATTQTKMRFTLKILEKNNVQHIQQKRSVGHYAKLTPVSFRAKITKKYLRSFCAPDLAAFRELSHLRLLKKIQSIKITSYEHSQQPVLQCFHTANTTDETEHQK